MRDFSIDLIWAKIQVAFTAIGGWIGWFLGGVDGMMIALIVLMVLDYLSGVMCAIADKKLSSAIGFKGICKKVLILMLVGVANIIDIHVVGTGAVLRGAVICFYLSNEGLSLLENAAYLGLPIPDKLREILAQLHNRSEKEKDKTEEDKTEPTDEGGGE
jgi:toxin secretion/phage lysis holin